jgi:hypothetical protein
MTINKQFKQWIPVFIFIAIAIAFRFYRTSNENHYLLAGSDGPYFPLQVRSLFEHCKLAFPDMPLLFVLCTLVAKLFYFLHLGTVNECVLLAVRFIDTSLPPFTAIPVFLIAKELCKEDLKIKFSNYFLVAFSILSFTPLYIFSFQLQKNSLATILIFTYLFFLLKIITSEKKSDLIKAIVVLILCAFTHFGSFGFLVFITITTFLVWLLTQKNIFKNHTFKILLSLVAVLIVSFSLIAFFDFTRFLRLINVPFKLFEAPVLLFALAGQNFVLNGSNLIILIAMNLLSIIGIIVLVRRRKLIDKNKYIIGLSMAICTIFLSNPMLGLEWASRLFMLAYIPATILYLILYNITDNKWFKIPTLFVFSFLLFISFGTSLFDKSPMTMDENSFRELQQMNDKNIFLESDAIVARQSLRILSNWVFNAKGVDKYLLTKNEYNKYTSVYLLKQLKGRNPNAKGSEPSLGYSVLSVYKGEHFEVFRLTSNAQLPTKPEKIFKGIKGTINNITENKLFITDIKTNKTRTIYYDIHNEQFSKLKVGMKVEVNGEWLPFSIDIKADTIKELDKFDDK